MLNVHPKGKIPGIRLTPFRIATIYAVFGMVALLVFDFYLPQKLSEPLLSYLQATKGAVEVVLTAGLIYLLTYYGQKQLQEANERLNEFSKIVSHDLRNPLTTLEGWIKLAEETGDAEAFDRCRDAIDRMRNLIDDLLALAQGGDVIGKKAHVNLADCVEAACQSINEDAATFEIEDQVTIEADPDRLTQLLENLFRNAVEHGRPDVTVRVGAFDEGVYIADDGPGIPQELRTEVFEPGYSTAESGTGFGLSIVKEITQAHGWDIDLHDSQDGGARFEISGVDMSPAVGSDVEMASEVESRS